MKIFTTGVVGVLLAITICSLFNPVLSVKPEDEIYLSNFNQSFYLKSETYTFKLIEHSQVPRQVLRHTIYTSSSKALQASMKRALLESEDEIFMSEEDHNLLEDYLGERPFKVKVDKKKRSLPTFQGDMRIIPLTKRASVLVTGRTGENESRKRAVSAGAMYGLAFCLHLEFFTTCDNSGDLDEVKNTLEASVNEIWDELDAYKSTNDARYKALQDSLNTQRNILVELATQGQALQGLLVNVAEAVQVNAATIADGDFQTHSQINYLKRVTNSLIKYCEALGSTDPRATTAQPAMSKLFDGYVAAIANLTNTGMQAIVDSTNNFTWTERVLPSQAVHNFTDPPCLTFNGTTKTCGKTPLTMSRWTSTIAFAAIFEYKCQNYSFGFPEVEACRPPKSYSVPVLVADTWSHWIYGPFHKSHYGIYDVKVNMTNTTQISSKVMRPIVQPRANSVATALLGNEPAYCVEFLGYTMFSSNINPGPTLINSYQKLTNATATDSKCDALRVFDAQTRDPGTDIPDKLYSLYAESEGVVIPFYSNCYLEQLTGELFTNDPSYGLLSSYNYVCSNKWTQSLPAEYSVPTACNITALPYVTNADVLLRHYITKSCYTNIEPGWLERDYYVNPPLITIPNIPRGYRLNQFTINAYGELASSIEFVYTDTWLPVYSIVKTSVNRIITDEISLLENGLVLFYMDSTTVIDESDAMFGQGNNGRDCIQKSTQYDYDLLNCYFQNDSPSYLPDIYFSGALTTSGISRYNHKFDFAMNTDDGFEFTLTPKKDSDFSYYIEMDGNLCPVVLDQVTRTSGCTIKLQYMNPAKTVSLVPDSSSATTINAKFPNATKKL